MINTLNTLGLNVEYTNPKAFSKDINTNTNISVLFNSDLNIESIVGNFTILKDGEFLYDSGDIDVSLFESLDGNITYKDKTVVFTPFSQLDPSCRYIIYIPKNSIVDILGNTMPIDYISYFSTEAYISLGKCEIVYPENNKTLHSLDKISLSKLDTEKYLIQISKIKTFDNLILERTIESSILEEDFKLNDGLYYIRAKALNGKFGESCVLTIKTHTNTTPTDQDLDESLIWQECDDNELEILESFPSGIDINEKTNILYMKFDKNVDINDIDFYESFVVGESSDDDFSKVGHGDVEGSYIVVNDDEKSETYVFFIPNSL